MSGKIQGTAGQRPQYKVILSPAEIKETELRYGDWLRMLGYLEA